MTEHEAARPGPLDPIGALGDAVARTAAGQPDDGLTISVRIAGGRPSPRYDLEFVASGSGRLGYRVESALSGLQVEARGDGLETQAVADLAAMIRDSGLLDLAPERPRFLPDTLVGIVDITANGVRFRRYFAADPDQAAVQGAEPPEQLRAVLDATYELIMAREGLESLYP